MNLHSPFRTSVRILAGIALFALAGVTPSQAQEPTPLALGSAIPMADAKLKNVDGKDITIAKVQGKKGTLVVFTCNACPWAKAWETRIVELGNTWASKGVGMIAINSNDPSVNGEDGYDVMKSRAKQRGMKFPYAVDASSDLARAFGATRTPEVFLFDAEGKLVYHGAVDDNGREPEKVAERYLADALTAISSGKEIAVAETKAMGCSIKFRKKA